MGTTKLIGIFNSTNEAKRFLEDNKITPKQKDRIICLGLEQTSYEWTGHNWLNINGIYIIGEKGEDGLDGSNGKDAKDINEVVLFNKLYETLKLDEQFAKKCKGEKGDSIKGKAGEKGDTPIIDMGEIIDSLIKKLLSNNEFLGKVKGKDGKDGIAKDGKDGTDGIAKDGKDGKDGIDGEDGRSVVLLEDGMELKRNQLGIDYEGNLYLVKNNTILCLKKS